MKKLIFIVILLIIAVHLWLTLSKKTFILYFHNVGEYKCGLRSMYISKNMFINYIKYLNWRGYKAVKLGEIVANIRNNKPIKNKIFAITFDDGYQNIYENAYPALEKLSYTATVFIATDEIGKTLAHDRTQPEKRLSEDKIKYLSRKWDFESHSVTHRYLDTLSKEELMKELTLSKKTIEKITNKKPMLICYPGGKYNNRVIYYSKLAGYKGACTTKPGMVDKNVNLYELPRVEWKKMSASSFKNIWDLKWFFIKIILGA